MLESRDERSKTAARAARGRGTRAVRLCWLAPLLALLLWPASGIADDATERLRDAQRQLQQGRYDEALKAFRELERRRADTAAVAIGESQCHDARGEWKPAIDLLAAAVKRSPRSAPLWATLARAQFAHGRHDDAGASAAAAIALDPDQPLARLVQADLAAATGRLQEADDGYRWFVRFYNRNQPKDPETLLLVAEGAGQYARWNNVTEIFDFVVNELCPDAIKADSLGWRTYLLSGSLLLEKYNRAQALPDLKRALAINPHAAEVHAALGNAEFLRRNLAEAEQDADRALEINPSLVTALRLKGALQLEAGHTRESLEFLRRALEVNPRDERTLAAVAACDLLEDGPPPQAEITQLLGHLDHIGQVSIPRPSRFAQLVIELAGRNPHPGIFLNAVGETLEGQRQFDLAEALYQAAVASMPQLSAPKTNLGLLYMRTGKNTEARPILNQAFEADPYDARLLNMRKVLEVLDGYQTIATEHFAIRVDPQVDKLLGKYMAEYLEGEYPGLVKQFGFEPHAPTQFEIYSNSKGAPAQQWFSARMLGLPWIQTVGASTGMLVALASPTAGEKPFNWARVVRHEFVHIITLQQTHFNIPHWYTEALAVLNEGYPRPPLWDTLLVQRSAKGELMNLDNINLGFIRPRTPGDWLMAYCQSELYAQYMLERFGPGADAKLLGAYRDHLATDRAIPRAFGVDQAAFERGYRDYLKTVVAEIVSRRKSGADTTATRDTTRDQAALERAVRTDSEDLAARKQLARMALEARRYADAARWGRMALEIDVRDPEIHRLLGAAYAALSEHARAIEEYGAALELKPDDPEIGVDLARAELAAGRKADARARLDGILGRHPDHARARELRKGLD